MPPLPLWCGGGVALSPPPPYGIVGVWYGMLGIYGIYGMYGRFNIACLKNIIYLVCIVGMV